MEQTSNNASTTITTGGGINSSATSFTVAAAGQFPSAGNFRLLVEGEIMIVTGVSGSTFTVTRGAESSIAASHAAGTAVYGILTKGALDAILTIQSAGTEVASRRVLNFVSGAVVADNSGSGRIDITISGAGYGAGASRPGSGAVAGQMYVPSDGIMTSIWNGSAWVGHNPLGAPFTIPPTSSGWTKSNATLQTITDQPGGGISVAYQYNGASNTPVATIYRTLSSGTSYSVKLAFGYVGPNYSTNGRYGIWLNDGTKAIVFGLEQTDSKIVVESYTVMSGTVTIANVHNRACNLVPNGLIWLRIDNDGTHRTYYFSTDGTIWNQAWQETFNTFLSETNAGFGISENSNSFDVLPTMNAYHWSGA